MLWTFRLWSRTRYRAEGESITMMTSLKSLRFTARSVNSSSCDACSSAAGRAGGAETSLPPPSGAQ
uniref:Uncharacterized protein n=1 Tax=Arundo donax TaxID=35708 RepID=A0A0A8Y8K2_ARUDO